MTTTDRDKLVSALRQSREVWLASLEGATNVTQRPEPNRWSVLEIAEHIAIVEKRLFNVIRNAPVGDPPLPVDEEREQRFLLTMENRDDRFNAPDVVQPPGKMKTMEEAIAAFENGRSEAIEYVASGADLRSRTASHLRFGLMSAYEMMLILAAHTNRHAMQVGEVRAALVA